MATYLVSPPATLIHQSLGHPTLISSSCCTFFSTKQPTKPTLLLIKTNTTTRPTKLYVSSSSSPTKTQTSQQETVYFDGGAHYGDLVANLLLGFTLVWLPLTLAAVLRGFFLRYRFTNLRVTVISGLTGQDRSDFSYKVIKDVKVVPRFIGEWGDVIITLKDGTIVDLRSVPKFREIAKYCLSLTSGSVSSSDDNDDDLELKQTTPKGF
uniref:uncharacterized protein LOC122593281 n=1 Tax=Erigeron canadensis TaxID=72917 RepID=UPI001CB97091|nr:uncharacterized protein LOC122593281 [Erigeron canadensis]